MAEQTAMRDGVAVGNLTSGPGEQLLGRNVQWFRGGLVFKAHRLLYRSTLGLRVIKKRREEEDGVAVGNLTSGPGAALSRYLPFPLSPSFSLYLPVFLSLTLSLSLTL